MSDSLIACRPSSLQWNLSVIHLEDFVSVWEAAERAADLSWRLGFLPETLQSSFPLPPSTKKVAKNVKFSNFDELHQYSDLVESSYVIPSGLTRHWPGKPWSLNCAERGSALEYDDEVSVFMQVHSSATSSEGDAVRTPDCAKVELSADVIERLSLIRSTTSTRLIQSHGLFETGIGTRSFTLQEVTPDSFVQQVRDAWPEFPNPLRIHFVWPQPQDFTPGIHFIVEFLPDGELPHHSIVPTLEETVVWSPFGLPDIQRQALYHTQCLQHADVTNPFADLCHRARFVCTVRALGRVLPVDAKINILSGALVQMHAHPPVLHEPPEFVDYFHGMKGFFADSLRLLEETFLPSISWRFHLLLPDGYQGVAETHAPVWSIVFWRAAPLWMSFVLWFFLACQYSSYSSAPFEEAKSKGQVGLVSFSQGLCESVAGQTAFPCTSSTRSSLCGSSFSREDWSIFPNHGRLQGVLEVQDLQESCKSISPLLCPLWEPLEFHLGSVFLPGRQSCRAAMPTHRVHQGVRDLRVPSGQNSRPEVRVVDSGREPVVQLQREKARASQRRTLERAASISGKPPSGQAVSVPQLHFSSPTEIMT